MHVFILSYLWFPLIFSFVVTGGCDITLVLIWYTQLKSALMLLVVVNIHYHSKSIIFSQLCFKFIGG